MYIGYRTVREGYVTIMQDYEDGDYDFFVTEKTIRVFLFVENVRKNPIYIFPEDVDNLSTNPNGIETT